MPVLECKELCKSYGRTPALDRLTVSIEPGRIVGLLGPNGSGKTTLIKLASGLLTPDAGYISVCGLPPGPESRKNISFLPERTAIPTWMSAKQLLDFYGDFYADFRRDAAEEMLAHLNIFPHQRIKQMSKGTREKVQLILVMSRAAKLYLLDEPIGGVDPATRDLYSLHHYRQLQPRSGGGDFHAPDCRRGKGAGRGDLHSPGTAGSAIRRG